MSDVRADHRVELPVDIWILSGHSAADHGYFGLRGGRVDARCQATEDKDRRSRRRGVDRGPGHQRGPNPMVHREPEAVRHNAHDRVRSPIQTYLSSDDPRIRTKPLLPFPVADHDHAWRALDLIGVQEWSAQHRRDPRKAKSRCSHLYHFDGAEPYDRALQISTSSAVSGHILD